MKKQPLLSIIILVILSFIIYLNQPIQKERSLVQHPVGIMGTTCTIAAMANPTNDVDLNNAILKAERLIRDVETKMSNWIDLSELSRFNRGEDVQLSSDTIKVLQAAFQAYEQSQGAFDITCRPLIELWKEKGRDGVMPTDDEIQSARDESNWGQFVWEGKSIIRNGSSARVDLGGIAKGYAIDLAIESLKQSGVDWGMVDIGGDLFLFNHSIKQFDTIEIKHPFQEGSITEIHVDNKAVCTSGNYARYIEIDGVKFSHIIDPRSGHPATMVPSVTVIAESAMEADIWATVLSVLGQNGLEFLPDGVEALLILGEIGNDSYIRTHGFIESPKLEPMRVYHNENSSP